MANKKTIAFGGIVVALVAVIFVINDQLEYEKSKVEFLEDSLAQKNLEYEWLSEIADELVDGRNIEELRPLPTQPTKLST